MSKKHRRHIKKNIMMTTPAEIVSTEQAVSPQRSVAALSTTLDEHSPLKELRSIFVITALLLVVLLIIYYSSLHTSYVNTFSSTVTQLLNIQ